MRGMEVHYVTTGQIFVCTNLRHCIFLETSFLLIYDKDRLDKVDLGRVGLLFVDLFWLKTLIQKLVI